MARRIIRVWKVWGVGGWRAVEAPRGDRWRRQLLILVFFSFFSTFFLVHTLSRLLLLGPLALLSDERLVDVRDDSPAGDGGLDEGVQLLVSPDGQLQMAGGDALHLQILGRVARQLKNLNKRGREINKCQKCDKMGVDS